MTIFFPIMYLLALVCFLVAAFAVTVSRVNLVALGLAFFTVPSLVTTIQSVSGG